MQVGSRIGWGESGRIDVPRQTSVVTAFDSISVLQGTGGKTLKNLLAFALPCVTMRTIVGPLAVYEEPGESARIGTGIDLIPRSAPMGHGCRLSDRNGAWPSSPI